jgi:hypothetical protein
LGSRAVRRFLPAAIFISILTELIQTFAQKKLWWRFNSSFLPNIRPSLAFTLGPEFLAALWSLKAGYGKFPFYILINGIAHLLFAGPMMAFFRKTGIVSLVRLSKLQFALLLSLRGIILYGFQLVKEKLFPKKRWLW